MPSVLAVVAEPAAGTEGHRQGVDPQRCLGQRGYPRLGVENIGQTGLGAPALVVTTA